MYNTGVFIMKKIRHIAILPGLAILFSLLNPFLQKVDCSVTETKAITSLTGPGDYYSSIDSSLAGDSLKSALHNLNQTKRKKTIGYDGLRSTYQIFDRDWMGQDNGKIVGFYDNALIGPSWDSAKTWNREHVWPNSRGGGSKGGSSTSPTVDQDAHMPRPTSISINSSRGNAAYAESGAYDPGSEGIENYRGIAARIIFYCAIADTQLSLIDNVSDSKTQMGKLSDLLKWNLQYLPSTSADAALELRVEQNRNETIQNDSKGQGNRNPFIDHPEYACKIWGDTNSTTKSICSSYVPSVITKLTMNTTSETMAYGGSLQLSVTPTPSDATASVKWTSSNENIATVDSNGLVTAKSTAGYVQITATSTYDSSITAVCQIYVIEPSNIDIESISSSDISLAANETNQIIVTTNPLSVYPTPTYSYSSNDISIATVDSTGIVTGVKEGNTTINITATQGSNIKTTTINVVVTAKPAVTEATITKDNIEQAYSETVKEGTASDGTKFSYINVGCYDKKTIQFRKNEGAIWNTEALNLKSITLNMTKNSVSVYGSNTVGTKETLISASSDGTYDLTGYKYYYLMCGSGAANASSIVIKYASSSGSSESISLDKSSLSLTIGDTYTLTATSSGEVTWSSSSPLVASVDNGKITALAKGTTTITATCGSLKATCLVTVNEPEVITLSKIETSGQTTNFNLNDVFNYDGTLTATYSNGATKTVTPTSISTVDMSTIGNKTITITYTENGISKTTSYQINVIDPSIIQKNENSVKKCYSISKAGTLGFSVYGVYMGVVNGSDVVIMNGEYGIMLYQTSKENSWVVGQTVLKVSSSTLDIYNNLYELKNCVVGVETDATTIEEEIYPVVTYTITGKETSSNQDLANRLSTATGVVKTLNSTSYTSGKDISGTIEINGNSFNIFAKKNTVASKTLFDALNESMNNNTSITLEGFTTIYKTTFQISISNIVIKDETYTAEEFANDFLNMTNSICETSKLNNWSNVLDQLSPVWIKLDSSTYFLKLSSTEVQKLIDATPLENGEVIEQAMNRYDHIIERYGLKNFIARNVTYNASNILSLNNNDKLLLPLIIISSITAVSVIGLILLKKKEQ